jgi:hypothetical protein
LKRKRAGEGKGRKGESVTGETMEVLKVGKKEGM